jgi:hypothetical protein
MDAPDFNLAAVDQNENNLEQLGFVELLQPAHDPVLCRDSFLPIIQLFLLLKVILRPSDFGPIS